MGETRILLVDDDEIVLLALTGFLVQAGFRVTTAANVTEALKQISGPETLRRPAKRPPHAGSGRRAHGRERDAPRESQGGDAFVKRISRNERRSSGYPAADR